ncbi:TIR domain-containing protein [Actinosynnema sp. NPDC053489]|uniref:TIR domain-containing protein n=1 Tax=Actinosynnema sp. NPDC053489 TaxID=3363916 RepID=UPI0037CBAD73
MVDTRAYTVFLSYAHGEEDNAAVEKLVRSLTAAGIEVIYDRQIADRNPSSLHQWISRCIRDNPVVYLISRNSITWYDNDDPTTDHLGIRYETKQVIQRHYEHPSHEGCPVIPVLLPGTPADVAPFALRTLQLAKLDQVDQIVARIKDAHRHERRVAGASERGAERPAANGADPGSAAAPRTLRDVLRDLKLVGPASPAAPGLVREWLEHASRAPRPLDPDAIRIFRAVERIIKAAGDVDLMAEVTDLCLAELDAAEPDETGNREKARWLICGRAWVLRKRNALDEALRVTLDGLAIARHINDQTLMATGWRCLSRIHLDLAGVFLGEKGDHHLGKALDYLNRAQKMFRLANNPHEDDVCLLISARIWFTRHRVLRDRKALHTAREHAAIAEQRLGIGRPCREQYEAALLRAEIAVRSNDFALANRLVEGDLLTTLQSRACDGASYAELSGRLHFLKAHLHRGADGGDSTVEIDAASRIFEKLGLDHLVAECHWFTIRRTHKALGFSPGDLRALERLCPDPVERVRVAAGGRTWTTLQGVIGSIGNRNWKKAVRRSRASRGD